MVTSKVWVLKSRPEGKPVQEDFQCIEEELPPCKEGEIIVEAEYITVDPYIRYRVQQIPLNTIVDGAQVSRVIVSKNKSWPVGSYGLHFPGWRSHTLMTKEKLELQDPFSGFAPLPDLGSQPRSAALGVLGMTGLTAYFGFLDICHPKAGETVLVNGAGGAVGSVVVQIAKIKGCKVIAFAGTDEKLAWAKELGADHVYNYKTTDVAEALKEAAPEGIHCYFDNVGGEFTAKALPFMAKYGRISVCGAISTYNSKQGALMQPSCSSPFSEGIVIWKELKIEGFLVMRWLKQYPEAVKQMKEWIEEGKLLYKETETRGFENIPMAFIGLFDGKNIGKAIVKV